MMTTVGISYNMSLNEFLVEIAALTVIKFWFDFLIKEFCTKSIFLKFISSEAKRQG